MTKKERHIVKEELKSLFNTFIKTKKFYQQQPSSLLADIEMAKQSASISGLVTFISSLYSKKVELIDVEDMVLFISNLESNTDIL